MSVSGRVAAWAAGVALVVLAGCGGGGGGGAAPSGAPIADTAAAWWNGEALARWAFVQTDTRPNQPSGRINLVTVGAESMVGGRRAVPFEHSSSLVDGAAGVEMRYFDRGAIYTAGEIDVGTGIPVSGAYAEVPAPLVAGVPTTVLDRIESIPDLDGDGRVESIRVVVVTTLEVEASRTVPAGTFSDVLRASSDATATVTLSALGDYTATARLTTWYAPEVGPIRREFVDPEFPAPGNVAIEELSGVSVAAVNAGTVPGYVALDAIGAGDSDPAGIPALATDGEAVLVVSRATGASGASVAGAILARDGRAIWSGTVFESGAETYLNLRTAAAFDGSAYQVFRARPSDGALVAQRISRNGDLLGPPAGTVAVSATSVSLIDAVGNGANLLLVWQRYDDTLPGHVIEAAIIDRAGAVVSPIVDLDAVSGTGAADLGVAWSGGRFLVARASGGAVSVRRLDGNTGAPLDAGWQVLGGSGPEGTGVRVVARPDGFLVGWLAWSAAPNAGVPNRVLGRRIGPDGNELDANPFAIDADERITRTSFALAHGTMGAIAAWANEAFVPVDTAGRGSATRAAPASGAPSFGAAQSMWFTQASTEPYRTQYATAAAPAGWLAVAWLENRETANGSDRVVATLVHPAAAR